MRPVALGLTKGLVTVTRTKQGVLWEARTSLTPLRVPRAQALGGQAPGGQYPGLQEPGV
jgi:hypothetical protein